MIVRGRSQGEVEVRSFALSDMVRYGYTGLRYMQPGANAAVTQASAMGIPPIQRAVRLRSEAVAGLCLDVLEGEGPLAKDVENWQAKLFDQQRYNEYQTRHDFWETVEESLCYRGNAYIWKLKDAGRVISWYALHPDQVTCTKSQQWTVEVQEGYVDPVGRGAAKYKGLNPDTILHIRGHGAGGALEAPSPVSVFRDTMNRSISRMHHETRMWQRGGAVQLAVTFPPGVTQNQANEWREAWQATYEGTGGDTTAIVGGGASIQPIGLTPADSRFVEMAHLSTEDAGQIMGVPSSLLMVQLEKSQDLEHDLGIWLRFGLGPGLERIENAISADEDLFPPGIACYAHFDTNGFVRGDILTEANVMHLRIQDGTLTPDEARALLGMPPHPDGVGAIPQITPVGGGPNPTMNGAAPVDPMPAMNGAGT